MFDTNDQYHCPVISGVLEKSLPSAAKSSIASNPPLTPTPWQRIFRRLLHCRLHLTPEAWVIHIPGHPQTRGRRPRRRRQVLRRHRVVAPLLRISLCASVFDPAAACSPPTPPPPTPPYRPKTTTPWLVKVPVPLSPPKPVFRMADIAALLCRPPGRFPRARFR